MLNELNKNHMSGMENTGADTFYNDDMGDAWDHRTNFPTKPIKVITRFQTHFIPVRIQYKKIFFFFLF